MNPHIRTLLLIQDIDNEAVRVRHEMERYEASERSRRTERERAQERQAAARAHRLEVEKRIRELDLQTRGWRDSLGKFSAQQNRVKTQKEYDALDHEIAETQAKLSQADETGLALLDEEELLDTELAAQGAGLAELERDGQEETKRVEERVREKRAFLERLTEKRASLVPNVDPAILHRFDQLCLRFPGVAVVPIENDICGGCNMNVVKHIKQAAQHDAGPLAECTSCRRILYVPE
jgi:predicted  nucleic acid-binding Zn-ribbon protein